MTRVVLTLERAQPPRAGRVEGVRSKSTVRRSEVDVVRSHGEAQKAFDGRQHPLVHDLRIAASMHTAHHRRPFPPSPAERDLTPRRQGGSGGGDATGMLQVDVAGAVWRTKHRFAKDRRDVNLQRAG